MQFEPPQTEYFSIQQWHGQEELPLLIYQTLLVQVNHISMIVFSMLYAMSLSCDLWFLLQILKILTIRIQLPLTNRTEEAKRKGAVCWDVRWTKIGKNKKHQEARLIKKNIQAQCNENKHPDVQDEILAIGLPSYVDLLCNPLYDHHRFIN